ncbi:MAG TPA: metallophosphoesterase [Actinomycetota bacterium]|jgi:3',5'-cyclic AMP phosphodiesterase CpdA|nr:metallophosphoesterase [Actinomycetota bacterium]
MTRILAVSDEVEEMLYGRTLGRLQPDLVVSCGDLPFDYLEYIVTVLSVPLLYVPGNHDPDLSIRLAEEREEFQPGLLIGSGDASGRLVVRSLAPPPGPEGCVNVDGRVAEAAGLLVAGLGGSINYTDGPNRYTQGQMRRRALRLQARARLRRPLRRRAVDVLVTHSPPKGLGDEPDDPAHVGFAAFHALVRRLRPRLLLHGHVHPHGTPRPDRWLNETRVVNVVPYRVLEVEGVQGESGGVPADRSE